MQIKKSSRKVTSSVQTSPANSIDTSAKSQKIVKSAIDDLGALLASCKSTEEKQAIQSAIANMSVVLLEMKK